MAEVVSIDDIPVPKNSSEITESWFRQTSGFKILPKTFHLTADVFSGAGCLSNVDRVQFKAESTRGSVSKSFIIKIPPRIKDAFTQSVYNVVTTEKLDQREVFFYNTLVPKLIEIIPELSDYIVSCIYAKIQSEPVHSSVLVFEDLRPLGYSMPSFDVGLTPAQLNSAIDFLTKFHFAGQKLTLEIGSLPEHFPILKDWHFPCIDQEIQYLRSYESLSWFHLGLPVIDRVLLNNSKKNSYEINKMRSAYSKLIPHTYKIIEILVTAGQQFPTLMHDDLWPNNFLVAQDEIKIKVLDWQLLAYSDPNYDLAVLLLSCLRVSEINEAKITEFVKVYYDKYIEIWISHTSIVTQPDRNLTEYMKFFFNSGLTYALAWFAMSCDSIESNPVNLDKLVRILEFLYEMGIPEYIYNKVHATN